MALTLRRTLTASARQVIRWCTPGTPLGVHPISWPPIINPNNFAGRWHEPAYVASFVLYGVPKLAAEWAAPLDAIKVGLRITGVFCHQSPKVVMNRTAWADGGECELGDLLVVHDHRRPGDKAPLRRAVLVQAKMPYATGHIDANPRQSFLYESWPTFCITKPENVFPNRPWDLANNSEGARYAHIAPNAPPRRLLRARSPWSFVPCTSSLALRGAEDMARFLAVMLDFDGQATRGRKATEGGADDWSALIDVMLTKMKLREFANRQLLGPHRGPRVVVAFAGGATLQLVCAGAAPPGGEGREPMVPGDAQPGVSTVWIETSAAQE